jgi:UDP-N-acetyl-D-glucosamine dehydrogenase
MLIKETLIKKFQDKSAKIGILGMGYVGMPLAVAFAEAGFNVLGIDPDQHKTDTFKMCQRKPLRACIKAASST